MLGTCIRISFKRWIYMRIRHKSNFFYMITFCIPSLLNKNNFRGNTKLFKGEIYIEKVISLKRIKVLVQCCLYPIIILFYIFISTTNGISNCLKHYKWRYFVLIDNMHKISLNTTNIVLDMFLNAIIYNFVICKCVKSSLFQYNIRWNL